jgi:predicted ATPase
MKLESIKLKNFKVFKDTGIDSLPPFCVVVGANGTGKSTVSEVFEFVRCAMMTNVNIALTKLGSPRGIKEVRTRGVAENEPIEIVFGFRGKESLSVTYKLGIGERNGRACVAHESLTCRGDSGQPWELLSFSDGKGEVVINEGEGELKREERTLKSNDILAVKGLAQFKRFPTVATLGNLIENWHVSDFRIGEARSEQEAGFAERLSREGDNLSLVVGYLYDNHREVFDAILEKMKKRVPGIVDIESKKTEEGRVLLRFQDGAFEDPFLAKFVSDGTIKMLAYLVLLNDPAPYPLVCVEKPENQFYPKLLQELAEEFRECSRRGAQVFVSTHSPDFLDAAELREVFWLEKKNGCTQIKRASENWRIADFMREGGKMGRLWKRGFFGEADPQ